MESRNEPNDDVIGTSTGERLLLLPEIVGKIVEKLNPSFEQLKTLRLVSKIWTKVTLPRWRTSVAVLTLVPEPSDQSDYKIGVSVSEFLTEFQDPYSRFQLSEKPFAKYKLKDIRISSKKGSEPDGGVQTLWTLIGPLIKSVHFYKCQFTARYTSDSLKPLMIQMIPNLQHLQLTGTLTPPPEECLEDSDAYKVDEKALHSNLRTLTIYDALDDSCGLEAILEGASGLEVIRGVNLSNECSVELIGSVFGMRCGWFPRHVPRPLSNLKYLDVMNSLGVIAKQYQWRSKLPVPEVPAGTQLPLETLAIHLEAFFEYPELSEDLRKFLNLYSSTLKTFKAFRAPVGGKPYVNFLSNCSMCLLTEMYLWGPIAPNFEFLTDTPNLKKLGIDLACFGKRDMLLDLIQHHNRWNNPQRKYEKFEDDMALNVRGDLRDRILCSELEYLEIDFEFPEESLRLMGKWMPNLRILKTILNEGTVPVVCEIWRDLAELVCLHGSKIGNGCFVRGEEEMAGFSGGAVPKLKICDLAELKRFQLDAYCGKAELTDEVVSNGFLKMTGLKCVEICVNSQMSGEAEEALRKGIQFCKVVRDDQCAGAGVDPSVVEAGARSGCDRCDYRKINEINGFIQQDLVRVEDEDG